MSTNAIVFFESYHKAIQKLDDTERLSIFDAIMKFGFDNEETDFDNPACSAIFDLIRPTLERSMNRYRAAKENGRKGGRPKTDKNQNKNQNTNQTGNLNKEKEKDKDKDMSALALNEGACAFSPPSLSEIKEFISDNGIKHCDPNDFFNHYESKGWKVGNSEMKNWKASVRAWDNRHKKEDKAITDSNIWERL